MANRIQFRRDIETNWTAANPLLSQGELGFETDTNRFKIGDGSTYWVDLEYTFNPELGTDQNLYTTSSVTFDAITVTNQLTLGGNIQVPTRTTPHAGTGQTLRFNDATQQVIITNSTATAGQPNSQRIVIQGSEGYVDTGEGGDVYLWAGDSGAGGGSGGDIKLDAGIGYTNSQGGTIKIRAGDSSGDGSGTGGFVEIHGGAGTGDGGPIRAYSGNGTQQLQIDNAGVRVSTTLTFTDSTVQTTAWTGSVSTSSVTGLSTIGYTGNLGDATGNISTSSVTGLSLVGYTNNYNDLDNKPTIPGAFNLSTVTNQGLFTTSTVTFAGVTASGVTTLSPINVQGITTATTIMTIGQTTGTNAGQEWQTVDLTVNSGASVRLITTAASNHTLRVDTTSSGAGSTIFKVRRKLTDQPFSGLNGFGGSLTWNLTDNTNTNTDFLRWNGAWSTTGVHSLALQTSNDNFSTNSRIVNFTTGRMQGGATSGTAKFTMTNSVSSSPSIELGAGSTATIAVTGPMSLAVYTAVGKPASGAVGSVICISNSAAGGNPNGMLAFWDTTNNRWSYVHDNGAV